MNQYIPGVCNIGLAEKSFRLKGSIISALIALLIAFVIIFMDLAVTFRILVFFPLFFAILNYFQFRTSFCVKFGIFGQYNFGNLTDDKYKIEENEFIKKDLYKSLQMIFISVSLSGIITLTFMLLSA